ncbi:site-specific integrase, partial [Streptomyces sp. NPDC002403]
MTTTDQPARAVADPVSLITDLITHVERDLDPAAVRTVVLGVVGGRAKSRRLAEALEARPEVLTDGRSPALRAIGDLLIALRKAGAVTISPPVCRDCGKHLRSFQRRGQDWYCSVCVQETAECAACGNIRRISMRDRTGRPRCPMCPDTDPRDPLDVIHEVITTISPAADRKV